MSQTKLLVLKLFWLGVLGANLADLIAAETPPGGQPSRARADSVVSGDTVSDTEIAGSVVSGAAAGPAASLAPVSSPVAGAPAVSTTTASGPMAELRERLARRSLAQIGRQGASDDLDAAAAAGDSASPADTRSIISGRRARLNARRGAIASGTAVPAASTGHRLVREDTVFDDESAAGAPVVTGASGFSARHENEQRQAATRNLIRELQLAPGTKARKLNRYYMGVVLDDHADVDVPGAVLVDGRLLVAPRTIAGVATVKDAPRVNTPLEWVIQNHDATAIGALEILLAVGANPNQVGATGKTPLQLAIQTKNLAAIPLLLQAGANSEGVLHYLLYEELNNEQSFKLSDQDLKLLQVLLKHGVDVNQVNWWGDTPVKVLLYNLIQALRHGDRATRDQQYAQYLRALRLFMQAGADPKIAGSKDENAYDELKQSHGALTPNQLQQVRLILDQQEHYLTYPWNKFPRIKQQLADELTELEREAATARKRFAGVTDEAAYYDALYGHDEADEKTGIVELTSKDDLVPRPESVQGPRALAAAVAALAAASDSSESDTDDETVMLGGAVVSPAPAPARIPVLGTIPLAPAATEHDETAQTAPQQLGQPTLRRSDSADDYRAEEDYVIGGWY